MIFTTYFDSVRESMRFLLAVGSVLGLLGLLISVCLIWSSHKTKSKYYGLLIVSFILVIVCGFYTGIKYFRL